MEAKKEHSLLKALLGILIIFALGFLGTLITSSATGGYIGGAIGALLDLYLFIIRN